MMSHDARMADRPLQRDSDRRDGIKAPPHEMTTPTHTMPDGTTMMGSKHATQGVQMAKSFLINRILQIYPAYYTASKLEHLDVAQLELLLVTEPPRPPGPPAPQVSFATYE